MTPLLTYQESI